MCAQEELMQALSTAYVCYEKNLFGKNIPQKIVVNSNSIIWISHVQESPDAEEEQVRDEEGRIDVVGQVGEADLGESGKCKLK